MLFQQEGMMSEEGQNLLRELLKESYIQKLFRDYISQRNLLLEALKTGAESKKVSLEFEHGPDSNMIKTCAAACIKEGYNLSNEEIHNWLRSEYGMTIF